MIWFIKLTNISVSVVDSIISLHSDVGGFLQGFFLGLTLDISEFFINLVNVVCESVQFFLQGFGFLEFKIRRSVLEDIFVVFTSSLPPPVPDDEEGENEEADKDEQPQTTEDGA